MLTALAWVMSCSVCCVTLENILFLTNMKNIDAGCDPAVYLTGPGEALSTVGPHTNLTGTGESLSAVGSHQPGRYWPKPLRGRITHQPG